MNRYDQRQQQKSAPEVAGDPQEAEARARLRYQSWRIAILAEPCLLVPAAVDAQEIGP
jgi:hypothetical protein